MSGSAQASTPDVPLELSQLQTQIRAARGTQFKMKTKLRELSMLVEETDMDLQKIMKTADLAKEVVAKQFYLARHFASSANPTLTSLPLPPPSIPPPPGMDPPMTPPACIERCPGEA